MRRLLILGVLTLLVSSTLFGKKIQAYNLKLLSVELNDNQSGEFDNKLTELNLMSPHYYDDIVSVAWSLEPTHLKMDLMNKSDKNLKLIWDELTYICMDNVSQRTIHTGRMVVDLEEEQLPTTVVKKSMISDCIVPIKNLKWRSNPVSGSWAFNYLFNKEKSVHGTEIRVLLPIEIDSKRYEYLFHFKVEKNAQKLRVKNTQLSLKKFKNL